MQAVFPSAVQARCGRNNMQMALGGDSGPLWGVRRAVQHLSLSETLAPSQLLAPSVPGSAWSLSVCISDLWAGGGGRALGKAEGRLLCLGF